MDISSDDNSSDDKSHRGLMATAVKWLESLRLPTKDKSQGSGGAGGSGSGSGGTPIITGLERVLFGTQAAADVVTLFGVHPPRYLCYMLSGFVCDIIQFVIDVILHFAFHLHDASLCWALGFGISVSFRHTSHRYLVFGDYVGGYWSSLGRMYAGYSIIIVLSTLFNYIMTRHAKLPHYVAWVVTLLWTGIVNYFILKKLWSFGGKQKTDTDASEDSNSFSDANAGVPEDTQVEKQQQQQRYPLKARSLVQV